MPALTADDRYFLLRRLHSLSGIVPLGGFLLFHFFENASALRGADAFNETVVKISGLPYLYLFEVFVLLIPLAFHMLFGLALTAAARPNVIGYAYPRNWAYFLQRLSGVLAFFFIVYHVFSTRGFALFIKGGHFTFADLQQSVSSPYVLALYILGITAVTYHLSNGLWSFSITWGLVKSAAGQRRLALFANFLFPLLCAAGLDILSAFVWEKSASSYLAAAVFG